MGKGLLIFGIASLVFRRNVGYGLHQFQKSVAPVVGLADDALPGFRDVVFDAHVVFKPERSADLRRLREMSVVYGVGQVEPGEGCASVLPGEKAGRNRVHSTA